MALSGKSKAELKQIAAELDKRQTELDNRESALASKESNLRHEKSLFDETKADFDAERAAFREKTKKVRDAIASEKADIEERRLEIAKLEAEAKNGFIEKQREAFKEVIEKRLAELDARQQELDRLEKQLAARYKELHAKEGEIAKRELVVTEREQKADAEFADKAKVLADEAHRQHQANQEEAERLQKLADELAEEHRRLEEEKAKLVERERSIITAEQKRDTGFVEERARVEKELARYREKRLSAIEQEIAELKSKRLREVTKAENAERDRILADIAAEREKWAKQQESEREKLERELERERTELEKRRGAISALQSELEGRRVELEAAERTLERKEQRLERLCQKRNEKLDDEIESRLAEERKSLEAERQSWRNENARLREDLRIQMELVAAFDQLKQQLGDHDPADILRELNSKTDEIRRLRDELATRPTEEMRERYKDMRAELERHKARVEELTKQIRENSAQIKQINELRCRNSGLEVDNKMLMQKAEKLEGAANEAQAELQRLRAAYERPAEVDARYREIEIPRITADKISPPLKDDTIKELIWLKQIGCACDHYGLHFHPRILKAFHTALKTAEWSPLTILAGVSGTGKSELPRLYSHFGGLVFEPVSVQPNWDSQESMLGFFNSIDNKFDAQPLLRFLAQSQQKWVEKTDEDNGYPGLQDFVCLVLLDEMNLAHPELYFAEFLSKLELRRGMKGRDVPSLPVKIGAGLPPYQLPLGRNVLWTGTMNQDETTKSLSDKVLDRSIIIYFPRPTTLKRRLKLMPLDEKNQGASLHKIVWQSWLAQGTSLSEEDIKPFKSFIEDMNKALAIAGRAIGHRIWQSIEYYMANYPDVRAAQETGDKDALDNALHVAFEDQLVQKIMPKLRGIDTRGKTKTDCLDKIRDQITTGIGGNPFHIEEDFDLSCELGYGQFIWQSANYLKDEQTEEAVEDTPREAKADDHPSKKTKKRAQK